MTEASPAAPTSNAAEQQAPAPPTPSLVAAKIIKRRQDSARYPDFVCRMLFRQAFCRLLFIIEVKRFPREYAYSLGPRKKNDTFPALRAVFTEARVQAFEQVQFAFERYPEENEIRTMSIVGLIFQVHVYKREKTPRLSEFTDKTRSLEDSLCYVSRSGPYHIFNERFTGYTKAFNIAWKNASLVKQNEVKQLLEEGKRGSVAANPLIAYDFDADK